MAHPHPYPDTGDDTGTGLGRELTPGTPRWVKVFGIVALVLALLLVVLLLTSGGQHGPGRHIPSGDAGTDTALIAGGGHQP